MGSIPTGTTRYVGNAVVVLALASIVTVIAWWPVLPLLDWAFGLGVGGLDGLR